MIGRRGLRDDFEEAIVFAGRLRQEKALQGGAGGDVFPALLLGGFVFLTEAGDFGNDDGLGAFALDPVVAALAFGGAAEDGFGEGQFVFTLRAAHEDGDSFAGFDNVAFLHDAIAHGGRIAEAAGACNSAGEMGDGSWRMEDGTSN